MPNGVYTKLGCTDAYATACRNTCVHLDGPVCNYPILISNKLNDLTSGLQTNDLDLLKVWDIGKYKLDFEIKENPDACTLYGTCLGQNANDKATTKTYSFEITIKRDPEVKTEIPKDLKLEFDTEKEISFKVTAIDNLPFTTSRKPALDLGNKIWNGNISPASPDIQIISESINPNDPTKYIFELKTKLKPNSLKKIDLEIPVIFPTDIFNPDGIKVQAKLTFNKILANFASEIISPDNGTLLTDKQIITSQVVKPDNLTGGLNPFDNCNKSVINYGIKTPESEEIKPIGKKSLNTNIEKVGSKGNKYISKIEFKDLLNFNLKNINEFKNDFLSGNIFGPIELYSEYSTSCSDKNLEYTGAPKTYTLIDYLKIIKGTCKHPSGSNYSKCEITTSNNTVSDNYELIISPNPSNCTPTILNKDKLTRVYKFSCLPPDISSFEVTLKRNNNFLNDIEKKLAGTGLSIVNNPGAIFADKKIFTVKNVQEDEETAFQIGDNDNKTASFNGKTISVRQLKDLLFSLGLISNDENIQDKYTDAINQAYWRLVCAIEDAKQLTLDPALRLQTAENPLKCTVTEFVGYPDIKYIEDVSSWKEFIDGLKARIGNDISAFVNPNTIQTIALFIALTTFLSPPAWVIFVSGFALAGLDINTRINEVNKLWSDQSDTNYNQTSGWKAGYSIGTLLTAVPGLIPANVAKNVKVAEIASKLDDYAELQSLILSEQRVINELADTVIQTVKQDELNNFTIFVNKLTES